MLRRPHFGCKICTVFLVFLLCFEFFSNYKHLSFVHESRAEELSAVQRIRRLNYSWTGEAVESFPDVLVISQSQKKKYTNQQARDVAIPLKEFQNIQPDLQKKPKVILLATPFHNMWSPDHYYALQLGMESFRRYECPFKNCIVINDQSKAADADAVVFHLRDIKIDGFQLPRKSSQIWILHSLEPPWLELVNVDMLEGVFNWTMSYRTDSDIVVRYGFIGRREPSPASAEDTIVPLFEQRKKAAVWFVSDCCTQSDREHYVRELKKYIAVDVFGGCGKDVCRPAETSVCYENVMKKYLFYIAFENAICKDYVTEKFYNILNYDVVPVVFGGARYRDIAPSHSYIDTADFSSPKALATFLNQLANNESLYRTYFAWKNNYKSYLSAWSCDLCKKLHLNSFVSTIKTNLKKWFVDDAQCQRWTKNGFVKKHYPVFPCYKNKIF